MAFLLGEAYLQLSTRGFSGVQADFERLHSVFLGGVASLQALTMASTVGYAAGVGTIAATVGAFERARDTVIDLRNALAVEGTEVEANTTRLTAYARALAAAANLDRAFVAGLETQAIRLGVSAEQAGLATKVAIGLAKARGVDEASALHAVTLAILGQEMALRRLIGLQRGRGLSGTALLAEASAMGRKGFLMRQADEASTFSGQLRRLRIDLEYAGESLGKAFAPGVERIVRAVGGAVHDLAGWASQLSIATGDSILKWTMLIPILAGVPVVVHAISLAAMGLARQLWSMTAATLANPWTLLIVGLEALGVWLVYDSIKGQTLEEKLTHMYDDPKAALHEFATYFTNLWSDISNRFQLYITRMEEALVGLSLAYARIEKFLSFGGTKVDDRLIANLEKRGRDLMDLEDKLANPPAGPAIGRREEPLRTPDNPLGAKSKHLRPTSGYLPVPPPGGDQDLSPEGPGQRPAVHSTNFFDAWTRAQTAAMTGGRGRVEERQLEKLGQIKQGIDGINTKLANHPGVPQFAVPVA